MLRLDIPITKVDAARRLVFGVATAEVPDRAGEICDYSSTKPFYQRWSEAIAKTTGGKSRGNLRAMHGAVAAGKVTSLAFNDDARQIEICAKVVDDAEWAKVAEGVYSGFSQGGSYIRRWTDANGATRYTADPSEISLVDLPCLAEARFEMIKADGTHEWRPFREQPSAGHEAIAKAGARNSVADLERIQTIHDTAVELGASCRAAKVAKGTPPADGEGALLRAFGQAVTSRFDALDRRIGDAVAELSKRLATIEAQPQPLPFASQSRAVSKGAEPQSADIDDLLADPARLSLLAIKLAQRQNR